MAAPTLLRCCSGADCEWASNAAQLSAVSPRREWMHALPQSAAEGTASVPAVAASGSRAVRIGLMAHGLQSLGCTLSAIHRLQQQQAAACQHHWGIPADRQAPRSGSVVMWHRDNAYKGGHGAGRGANRRVDPWPCCRKLGAQPTDAREAIRLPMHGLWRSGCCARSCSCRGREGSGAGRARQALSWTGEDGGSNAHTGSNCGLGRLGWPAL